MNRECIWPKLYKRGPAKGYIEALEHRLAVTEAVLLQLFQVSGDAALRAAFQREKPTRRTSSTEVLTAAGKIEAKKTGTIAHWESFPLGSAEEVRRWAREALGYDHDHDHGHGYQHQHQHGHGQGPGAADGGPNDEHHTAAGVAGVAPFAEEVPIPGAPMQMGEEAFDLSQDFRRQFVW